MMIRVVTLKPNHGETMGKITKVIAGLVGIIMLVGCTTLPGRTVPSSSLTGDHKVLYLAYWDTVPKDILKIKAMQFSSNIGTNKLMMLDPAIIAIIAEDLKKVLPDINGLSNDSRMIRENTAIRRVEILIKDCDLNGSNIVDIVKTFKEITGEKFPTVFK